MKQFERVKDEILKITTQEEVLDKLLSIKSMASLFCLSKEELRTEVIVQKGNVMISKKGLKEYLRSEVINDDQE